MSRDQDTEQRIFEAAQTVFHEQGFDGARMADIARRAEINQSMLHYYFRSKEQLFDAVFQKAAQEVLPPVLAILREDTPLLEKLDRFVRGYVARVAANPHLPAFVIQELRRNPDGLRRMVGATTDGVFARFREDVSLAVAQNVIRPVDPDHLIANVMAMCLFPFIARPMLQTGLGADDVAYERFLADRAGQVIDFVREALRP